MLPCCCPHSAATGFSWLVRTFLTDLWPALGGLLVNYQATGDWLQPATRCLTTLLRVQVSRLCIIARVCSLANCCAECHLSRPS